VRVLVCDDHVVFAESVAHLLGTMGVDIVAVTFDPNQALPVLRREPVDICLLDVQFGGQSALGRLADLRAAAPRTAIVLLCAQVDGPLVAAARVAGVRAVADKRQPINEIVRILERVQAGETVLPRSTGTDQPQPAGCPGRTEARPAVNHAQRLAGFLTPREREVLSALVCGQDTARLARTLGIAETTARCHVQAVLIKLGAHSRLEAATTAVRYGMINPTTGQWLVPAR
jgi:two-component system nitrate/nitrite response regulator NarL